MARTYVDGAGVVKAWINSRTGTLVGVGNPLMMGAHLKHPDGGAGAAYAFLEEQFSVRTAGVAESPDLLASLSAQVYADTREAATAAAVALAEEISTVLEGRETPVPEAGAVLLVSDDITGPAWVPDGNRPRLLVNFTVQTRPA